MRLTQLFGERVIAPRQGHQIGVVRHQLPAGQSDIVARTLLARGVKTAPAILVEQENILALVASLGDLMRPPPPPAIVAAWNPSRPGQLAKDSFILLHHPSKIGNSLRFLSKGWPM